MAITELEHMEGKGAFGVKIFTIGAKRNMRGPAAIARGLYENDGCYNLIHPKDRPHKDLSKKEKDLDTIGRTVQRHFEAESPTDVSTKYLMAYSLLFNVSMDYLCRIVEDECPNVDVLAISQKTGLSVLAVSRLVDECRNDGNGSAPTLVHQCWSHLLESDLLYVLPSDLNDAYREECERIKCEAAIKAIMDAVGEDESIGGSLVSLKAKPIETAGQGHYAAYFGMLYKLSQDITSSLNALVMKQTSEDQVYEKEHTNMLYQFKCEMAAANGEPMPPKPDGDGFRWHSHIIV